MKPASMAGNLDLLHDSLGLFAKSAALSSLLAGTLIGLTACGGSTPPPVAPLTCSGATQAVITTQNAAQTTTRNSNHAAVASASAPETGPPAKIITIAGGAGAVVALFPDGTAYYSVDGFNLGGGGSTVAAYSGSLKVLDIVAVGSGVDALLSDGSAFFSPDGQNLGGGGATVRAYEGPLKIASLTQVGSGVDAVFSNGPVFYSPDGLDLGGCGLSAQVYAGNSGILKIVAVGAGDAVVTLFSDGAAFYSPNNRDIGGGGSTVSATPGTSAPIKELVKVGGGVLAELNNGAVYLSPDGNNLAGGGATVLVPSWNTTLANGPFQARDSAHGTEFLGRLWLSGGFADPTYSNSCFATCSFFDLWSSTDSQGASWNSSPSFATATTPDPRDVTPVENNGVQDAPVPTDFYDSYGAIVVWQGQLTAIGATVWHSADGVTWARQNLADGVTAAPGPVPVRANENSRALVLGASLFFLQPDIGEVYRTADPSATGWTTLGPIPHFTARCAAAVFVMQGKIWIEGGGACDYSHVFNDVWSSADGVNWTQNAKPAEWSARMWPCVASGSDGIMWLAGGYAPTDWTNTGAVRPRYGANHADVWYSKDGANWQQLKADLGSGLADDGGLEPRHAATCYRVAGSNATTGSLVIMAGTGGTDPNDSNARTINSIRALPLPAAASLP